MIIDKLENMHIYNQIPNEVVEFVNTLDTNTSAGKYIVSDSAYVNIEEYDTKNVVDVKFESHNKYIDIQFLLAGEERIFYSDLNNLNVETPYNTEKDITFYKNSVANNPFITLNGTNFVMLYPHEAHAPQVSIDNTTQKVKKVVVKLKI